MSQGWLYMVACFLRETGWNNHFNYHHHHHGRRKKRKRSPGGGRMIRWNAARSGVRRIKPEDLCQLHICEIELGFPLVPSTFYPFSLPSRHHHRLTKIYPRLELITCLSTTVSPWGRLTHPLRDLLSVLHRFLAEEEVASDMLAWEETLPGRSNLWRCVCMCVSLVLLPALSARCQKKAI